ncbi:hypothetical protein LCGC14_1042820 [marine sediment metagenome]|uniref:Uncharacterized protein n=1 Tax=marine sediment metagenome TaxID=412755 RepID=A0A0F9MVN6_9ZZZZ
MPDKPEKHAVFSDRMKNWFNAFQGARDELARLDEIYTNETVSGAHADFVDTPNASKQEHIDGIVFMRGLVDFVKGGVVPTLDRREFLNRVLSPATPIGPAAAAAIDKILRLP